MALIQYAKAAAIIAFVDVFWLLTFGIYARDMFYNIQGSSLKVRYGSAAIVYVFLSYMLLQTKSYTEAFMYGAAIYGVYEFTNHALFTNYDSIVVIADTLWGGVLFVVARYLLLNVF